MNMRYLEYSCDLRRLFKKGDIFKNSLNIESCQVKYYCNTECFEPVIPQCFIHSAKIKKLTGVKIDGNEFFFFQGSWKS